ncbi:MAG: hypothetical protein JJU13_19445 [Balneolaceae bacterium]|nr:hypothetical protein [Balneolaceae bacterium]
MKKLISIKNVTLTSLVFFFVLSLSACSDIAGPEESTSSEFDFQTQVHENSESDLRRRIADRSIGGAGTCTSGATHDLNYGRNAITMGSVKYSFTNDGGITITYQANDGWTINDIAIQIAKDKSGIPHNNGGAIPGRFDTHQNEFNPGVTFYSYTVSAEYLNSIGINKESSFVIAAKASVSNGGNGQGGGSGETAYAGNEDGGSANFWTYISAKYNPCSGGVFNSAG